MATVTGYTTPIDTSTFAAAFGTGKLEVLYVWSGIIGFEIGGQRIVNLYGDFDFTSMKTLAVSPVTGIEVTLTDENETPVMEVTDMSVPFGAFDKGDMRLVLAGDDTITGSTVADRLFGHDGNDVVDGRAGDDLLDGGKGADVMLGGPGDDVYIVDNKRDVVVELPGEGIDTVRSTAAFTLPEHVENLELLGKAKAGTGNDLANVITGNAGKNTLLGGAGDDTLIGLGGKDILEGGLGADRFVWLEVADGTDTIRDFTPEDGDVIDLSALVSGFTSGISEVADYLRLTAGKKGATLALYPDGADEPGSFLAMAVLTGFDATTTSVEALVADGSILIA